MWYVAVCRVGARGVLGDLDSVDIVQRGNELRRAATRERVPHHDKLQHAQSPREISEALSASPQGRRETSPGMQTEGVMRVEARGTAEVECLDSPHRLRTAAAPLGRGDGRDTTLGRAPHGRCAPRRLTAKPRAADSVPSPPPSARHNAQQRQAPAAAGSRRGVHTTAPTGRYGASGCVARVATPPRALLHVQPTSRLRRM